MKRVLTEVGYCISFDFHKSLKIKIQRDCDYTTNRMPSIVEPYSM